MQIAPGREKGKPEKISLPLHLLYRALYFLPYAMLMVAGLVDEIVQKRHETSLARQMRKAGRLMKWQAFAEELKSGHGTVIIERFSLHAVTRIWWTQEELSAGDRLHSGLFSECSKGPACDFCALIESLYTSPANGQAYLVAPPTGKKEECRKEVDSITEARHITTRGSDRSRKSKS